MTENGKSTDVLKVQGRMTRGYGIIPKMPMQDQRLTIEAKAIYSYFCSYAGAGTQAFPSRDKILYDFQISENRYYKHFNLLKQCGYIEITRNTDNIGKFTNNVYTLVEMIEPYLQNEGTAKPYLQNPGMENPCLDFEGTKNNNLKSNIQKNQQSESKSTSDQAAELYMVVERTDKTTTIDNDTQQTKILEMKKELLQTSADQSTSLQSPFNNSQSSTDDYNAYRRLIQDNICYSHYLHNRHSDIELIDELINCMLDVICTKGETVKINGEEKSRSMVKSQYLKINSTDIEHILDRYKSVHHNITHLHSYLKTMLYTVKQENGHYYTNAVRTDGLVLNSTQKKK